MYIPNTFDNFQQRQLSRGTETKSETYYKGYIIVLRAYSFSGISGKIMKILSSGKWLNLRQKNYNYCEPIKLLNELKNYIDNYEVTLIKKLNEKTRSN